MEDSTICTPSDLIQSLVNDVQILVSDVLQEPTLKPQCVSPLLLGTVLDVRLPLNEPPEAQVEAFRCLCERSREVESIHSAWIDDSDRYPVLWLIMGFNIWRSVRRDRLKGSQVWSVHNSTPMSSLARPQRVRLSVSDGTVHEARVIPLHDAYQEAVWFLRASLRLNAQDSSTVVDYLLKRGWDWRSTGSLELPLNCPLLNATIDALSHPVRLNYLHFVKPALSDNTILDTMSEQHQASAINRHLHGKWLVLIHCRKKPFYEISRSLQPSYFCSMDPALKCSSHVQVLEATLCQLRFCHLLAFDLQPTEETIRRSVDELFASLGLGQDLPVIWSKPDLQVGEDQSVFRADGAISQQTTDRLLLPRIRDAKSRDGTTPFGETAVPLHTWSFQRGDRDPVTIVIWARSSKEEGRKVTNWPRQVWSTIVSPPEILRSRQREDNVIVIAESCSSSKHPWHDRRAWFQVPKDRPVFVLTSNPDRLTRRADELDHIRRLIADTGGGWYTRGIRNEYAIPNDWVLVDETVGRDLVDYIAIGRQRAVQSGHYNRCHAAMSRVLMATQTSSSEPIHPQFLAMSSMIRLACRRHQLNRILILVRESPTTDVIEESRLGGSLVRQHQFIRSLIPSDMPVDVLKASQISAFNGSFLKILETRLASCTDDVLIVSTSIDRVIRNTDLLPRLMDLLGNQGHRHMIMSLLWDHATFVEPEYAIQVRPNAEDQAVLASWGDALEAQIRAPISFIQSPTVQPIIWAYPGCSTAAITAQHVDRLVRNAQAFIHSLALPQDTADLTLPMELALEANGQGMDVLRAQRWTEFLTSQLDISTQNFKLIYPQGSAGFLCSCRSKGLSHDAECLCRCTVCDSFRTCDCSDEHCVCPPMCNCLCDNCHCEPVIKVSMVRPLLPSKTCATPGCTGEAIRTGGRFCGSCKYHNRNNRPCATVGCENMAPLGGAHGVYCTDCATAGGLTDPATLRPCDTLGCAGFAPYGRRCASCKAERRNEMARANWHAVKEKAEEPSHQRPCATEGCQNNAPLGGIGRRYCASCNKARRKAKRQEKRGAQAD